MMVIAARGTLPVPANNDYIDRFHGDIGQTVFEMQGAAAIAARQGATITIEASLDSSDAIDTVSTIGGTRIDPRDVTVTEEEGIVIIAGLRRPANTAVTQSNPVGELEPARTTRIPITNNLILDAIFAGVTGQITFNSFNVTDVNGAVVDLTDTNAVEIVGTDFIISNPELINTNYAYTASLSIPAFTTSGIPHTRENTAGREVILRYNIGTYQENVERVYPADRCSWVQEISADTLGYHIVSASFFNGRDAGMDLHNPRLGYIGKSGRFVAITDHT